MPELLNLYSAGRLKLDELITKRYTLDDINQAYADMRAGVNIRGVIDFIPREHHRPDLPSTAESAALKTTAPTRKEWSLRPSNRR